MNPLPRRVSPEGRPHDGRAGRYDALVADQADEHPDRERAAAEAEGVDAVAGLVVLAEEAVEPQEISLEADAECPAEEGEGLERGRPDAVVVAGHLYGGILEAQRLVDPPDVGLEQPSRAVPGAVGEENDVLGHPRTTMDRRRPAARTRTRQEGPRLRQALGLDYGTAAIWTAFVLLFVVPFPSCPCAPNPQQ